MIEIKQKKELSIMNKLWNDSDRPWRWVIRLLIFGITCKVVATILGIVIAMEK